MSAGHAEGSSRIAAWMLVGALLAVGGLAAVLAWMSSDPGLGADVPDSRPLRPVPAVPSALQARPALSSPAPAAGASAAAVGAGTAQVDMPDDVLRASAKPPQLPASRLVPTITGAQAMGLDD